MTERFIVDDAGTLIDMHTRDMFDIVEEVCPLLNEQHEENEQLRNDCSILILSNQDYRKENEELKQRIDNICREINDRPTMTTTEVMVKLQELIF